MAYGFFIAVCTAKSSDAYPQAVDDLIDPAAEKSLCAFCDGLGRVWRRRCGTGEEKLGPSVTPACSHLSMEGDWVGSASGRRVRPRRLRPEVSQLTADQGHTGFCAHTSMSERTVHRWT